LSIICSVPITWSLFEAIPWWREIAVISSRRLGQTSLFNVIVLHFVYFGQN
jgi:hypothetical protein